MYLGTVKKWNDPQIAKLNPGVSLPDTTITPVYRSDGSGTSYNFTDYLSAVSPAFKSKIGISTQPPFPTGVGGRGSSGVAGVVKNTEGAVGYADIAYAVTNHIPVMAVRNAAGKYTTPGIKSITAASVATKKIGANNELHIVNPPKIGAVRVPDRHLHLRHHSGEHLERRPAQEVHLLGAHRRPEVRGEAPVRADPEARAGRLRENTEEGPDLAPSAPVLVAAGAREGARRRSRVGSHDPEADRGPMPFPPKGHGPQLRTSVRRRERRRSRRAPGGRAGAFELVEPPVVLDHAEDAHESGALFRCQEEDETALYALGLHDHQSAPMAVTVGTGTVKGRGRFG